MPFFHKSLDYFFFPFPLPPSPPPQLGNCFLLLLPFLSQNREAMDLAAEGQTFQQQCVTGVSLHAEPALVNQL